MSYYYHKTITNSERHIWKVSHKTQNYTQDEEFVIDIGEEQVAASEK